MTKVIKEHRGWRIFLATVKTDKGLPYYFAVKNDSVMEGVDLPDLIADIDEAEK